MSLEIQPDLAELQQQRERQSRRVGILQFHERTNLGSFQQRLLKEFLPPLIEVIDERKSKIGKQRTKARLADFILAAIGSEELALITLFSVMYCISDSQQDLTKTGKQYAATLRRTALRIGQHCKDEFFGEITADPGDGTSDVRIQSRLMTALINRQTNRWNASRRAEKTIEAMRSDEWWSLGRMLSVGGELVHLAIETTGLFQKTYKSLSMDFEKRTAVLRLTDLGATWLDERRTDRIKKVEDEGILAVSVNLPMLVEPRPWEKLSGGGYLTLTSTLVKANDENFVEDEFYKVEEMPSVVTALDVLQRTAWEINTQVFEVYKRCWDNRSYRTKFFNPEHTTFSQNELVTSIETKIATTQNLVGRVFYFPYQLDFRGRVYSIPHILNTQSDDATRSLLQFGTEQPVTDSSEYWTGIHAANSFGLNKQTLESRYKWCQENWLLIEALAEDPYRHIDFWDQAKEPFAFLAACMELTKIKHGAKSTRLPVYVDGKCNGLQHLSAMSLDELAGQRVNLLDSDEPQDIYDHIAKKVHALVTEDQGPWARYWTDKIDRDLVKRPVMTTPYGVTPGGIKQQLKDASRADWDACAYLADKVEAAIKDVMRGPAEVQTWLQGIAKAVTKAQKPVVWTTPTGFRVCQDYRKPLFKRLSAGKFSVRYYLPVDGQRPVNKRKQELGIIANYVHSMDGAHLVQVVNRLKSSGINEIGVVHDSFGVHACHAETMNQFIREEFVRIYSERVLDVFLKEQIKRTGITLPAFDGYGKLAINDVLKSPYFFS